MLWPHRSTRARRMCIYYRVDQVSVFGEALVLLDERHDFLNDVVDAHQRAPSVFERGGDVVRALVRDHLQVRTACGRRVSPARSETAQRGASCMHARSGTLGGNAWKT